MSDQSTADTLRTAIGAGSLGFGLVAILAPATLAKTYGMNGDSADMHYMGRAWGSRTALLGALSLTAGPEEQQRLAVGAAALNAVDTLAVLATSGLPARTKAMASLTSAAFCAASVYVAQGG